jgi:predicted anti-sigma-YlaC factor YlaD
MEVVRSRECERARALASIGLDGELSQVGQAALRAHVGRCATCAAFARNLGALTQELRAAPLERPPVAPAPSSRSRSTTRALQLGAAAAAVMLAAGLGSLAGSMNRASEPRLTASHAPNLAFARALAMTGADVTHPIPL